MLPSYCRTFTAAPTNSLTLSPTKQVDEFEKLGHEVHQDESYVRPALRNTKFAYMYETVPVAV